VKLSPARSTIVTSPASWLTTAAASVPGSHATLPERTGAKTGGSVTATLSWAVRRRPPGPSAVSTGL
jgi:hypothetical protein